MPLIALRQRPQTVKTCQRWRFFVRNGAKGGAGLADARPVRDACPMRDARPVRDAIPPQQRGRKSGPVAKTENLEGARTNGAPVKGVVTFEVRMKSGFIRFCGRSGLSQPPSRPTFPPPLICHSRYPVTQRGPGAIPGPRAWREGERGTGIWLAPRCPYAKWRYGSKFKPASSSLTSAMP